MNDTVTFGALNYSVLFSYLAVMFGIGLWFAGKQKTTDDYFLAGRNMPWLVVAMSMFASLVSAVSYMGIPSTTYEENIALFLVACISPIATPFLIFLFYPFYRKLNVTTSYEYIDRRYGRNARFAISTLFILTRLGWLGVVIYAPALALSVVTGINLSLAIAMMGILATVYTVMGGLAAVLWTDVLQFVFLAGGAVWIAITLLLNVPDGLSGIITIAHQTDHLHLVDWKLSLYKMSGPIVAFSCFFQTMQDFGTDQISVQRLMAVKDFRSMAKAAVLASLFDFCILGLLVFIGLGMFAYFQNFPERLAADISADKILPYYIMHALPNGLSGLLITAIFAAAMSSMDSGINSIAAVIINDFVKPLRCKPRTGRQDVRLARILTFVLGVFAVVIAYYVSTIERIYEASNFFLGLFAAPTLAFFLLGIFTRRASFKGWLVGTAIAIPAIFWLQYYIKVHFIYYFPFSLGITLVIGYLASLLFGGPKAKRELTLWGRSKLTMPRENTQ